MSMNWRLHVAIERQFLLWRPLALCLLFVGAFGQARGATISFIQSNFATPQTPQTTVSVTFTGAQTLGNLNVVVVGWNDSTASVSSVTDTKGNTYVLAVGPTVQTGVATQAIYYAKNITAAAATANAVTVTFTPAAAFPDIRIAEYSGLDTVNTLDVSIGAQGNSTTGNSGPVTTTNANDLLVGANLVQSLTSGPGTGYTSRTITSPDGDILEDRVVTTIGSYNATAPLASAAWIMQMVAFRAASGGTPTPSITSLNPTSGPIGTSVTITGTNFGVTQGGSSVTFNGTTATPASWTATSIVVPVPSGATSGNVVVTVNAVPSNGVSFTVGTVSSILFVQTNSATPQATVTSVPVVYTGAQTPGNLNIVVVGWNDSTASVNTVTDSLGNNYAVAASPIVQAGIASQAIYYAKNIAAAGAGANTVTVTFTTAARHPDIRIAEYSGLDPLNPLDTAVGAQGSTTATSDSGFVVTGNPNDLLVGANTVQASTIAAGTGYTSRGITADGDILEDQVVSATGSYNATAALNTVQLWIMQMAAFRAAGGGGGTAPNIVSLNPASGQAGTSVTITGANFGTTQGTSTVSFNGLNATVSTWSAASIVAPVPGPASTGPVVVTVGGVASNGVTFTVTPDTAPPTAPANLTVTAISSQQINLFWTASTDNVGVTGYSIERCQGAGCTTFAVIASLPGTNTSLTDFGVVGSTSYTYRVRATDAAGNLSGYSNTASAITQSVSITSLNPTSGAVGTPVAITGTNFGATQGTSTVTFNGVSAGTASSWSATSIGVTVPPAATTGNVVVTVGGVVSNGVGFTVMPDTTPPTAPTNLFATASSNFSTQIQLSWTASTDNVGIASYLIERCQGTGCTNFAQLVSIPGNSTLAADGSVAPASTYSYRVRAADAAGNLSGYSNIASATTPFGPTITSLSPFSGPAGTSVTITGTNFGTSQGTSAVTFSGTAATPTSWNNTSIIAPVPAGATTGNVVVTVGGVTSNAIAFIVSTPPSITSLNPTSGAAGTSITIAGTNFGATQGTSTVTFNGTAATPTNWSATSIVVPVPAGAITGNVVVTVAGMASNGVNFTVPPPPPSISGLSPSTGAIGSFVTISGANFGASQGTSTVTFNGISSTPTSWSASSVIAPVPVGAATGNVIVTVGGVASNGMLFTVQSGTSAIKLVQHVGKDAGSTTSSTLAFPASNAAGNWIAVAVRAGRSGQVFTVTDTRGNTYRKAVQFNVTADTPNGDTLGIFYAENIAGGANTVTVADTINGSTLRFAILEYSGVALANSLDVIAVTQGTGAAPNSGTVVTTAAGDLLFGAIMTSNAATYTGGAGFTVEDRVPAAPSTKLMDEDQIQTAAGNASTSASLAASDIWGAALAAFKVASGGGAAGPGISNLNPSSGPVGTSVTISGSNFGATQGTSTVTFNGIAASPASWSATSIVVPVPANATSGNVVVTVVGLASNGVPFAVTVIPPSITSLNPTSGAIGASVIITGVSFGASQGTSSVTFNGIVATPTNWSATSIGVPVPNGATTGNVVVTVGGLASNGMAFTVTNPGPSLSTLSMTQGPVGAILTITGLNFGTTQGTSTVTFNATIATPANWSATSIDVPVPSIALGSVSVVVTVGGVASNGLPFTVTPPPNITSISPTSGPVGTAVTVNGTNFGPTVGTRTSVLSFNGTTARTTNWGDTQILAPVPSAATTGNVVVSISGVASNAVNFTVTLPPSITSLNPTSGPAGTSVTITGANFGATKGTSTVTFNGTVATPTSWSDPSIVVPVPSGATTGNVVVTVGGVASNGVNFTVTPSGGPITLVQHISRDAGTASSTTITFPSANTAGNWIAVMIRAGKSGQVFTVTDTRGNTYHNAIQFNEVIDGTTLGIFYAENITGGVNTVTVSDTILGTLRVAILEYSGVALANSLDGAAVGSQGTSASPTVSLTTTVNGDLLLCEMSTANAAIFTAGSGYTIEETVPAEPNTKLIVEDRIQTTAGNVSASASLAASDSWGAALAAFKSGGSGAPPPISVSVSPTSASVVKGLTQNFTATVTNDAQNAGVTWSLSGAGCSGNACGTLSNVTATTVTYTAPATVPNPATVTLTATSVTDNTKSSAASITVLVSAPLVVSVSPKRGALTFSQTQQFTATVTNDPLNSGVTWSVDGNNGGNATTGTVTPAGLFAPGTQPGVHTVTATSNTNASISDFATAAVTDLQGVLTHHNDVARTGQNQQEYALTPATVGSPKFTKLFSCPVDGYVYAEPLYVANLLVGSTTRNVLFVATEHDSVYAFDADSPSCLQLWKTSFLGTNVTTMSYLDTGGTDDVFPEIGITSTPVIDPATGTMYVEAKTKESVGSGCSAGSPCYIHRLHALDIITGSEKLGGPVVISAPNFVSLRHFNRPALLLANSTLYIGFGSHGDISPWFGWLFGYDPATLAQKFVFSTSNPTSGSNGASIWSSGAGPAADASGNVYVATGNGAYDGTKNFSESVLKISPTGSLIDWFTPFNRATFDANDIDLGSAGVIVLPDTVASTAHPHLALATGKIAILYLLDISQPSPGQTKMGKFNSGSNLDVQEVIPVPPPNTTQLDGGNYGIPAYWNGNIYTTGQNFPLSQFTISNGAIATPQFAVSSNMFPSRGATPAVSASGATNGVVWVLDLSAWTTGGAAILDAYDATNVANRLFSSPTSGSGAAGPAVKFTVPTVANGKVYVGGQSTITVFGLLPN